MSETACQLRLLCGGEFREVDFQSLPFTDGCDSQHAANKSYSRELDFIQWIIIKHFKEVYKVKIKPPMIHRTYISSISPDLIVYTVNVNTTHSDENLVIGFIVECCDPAYKDDVWNADGYEMTEDVWDKYEFTLVPE